MTLEDKKILLIRKLRMLSAFWEKNEKANNVRERLDGLTFSILCLLDGMDKELKDIVISIGKKTEGNIAGNLRELYYNKEIKNK